MSFKRRFYVTGVLVIVIAVALMVFPASEQAVHIYDRWFYYPLQALRDLFFGYLPFSIGDMIYIGGGTMLLLALIKWVKYLFHFRANKSQLGASVLNVVNVGLAVYLYFVLGWGANYYKEPLAKTWALHSNNDTVRLGIFDSMLVAEMNRYAPGYKDMTIAAVNKVAASNYRLYSDSRLTALGLNIKPSLFGYFLERLAIEGYYNPFTGEGQVSGRLPAFMLPFVVSHEMAHQAGVAAEGDANLMAYSLCKMSSDPAFKYSADLNVWLYVDRRLRRKDSVRAKKFATGLNSLSQRHVAILDSLSDLYDNDATYITSEMYDNYLKLQHQKDGIRSYSSIVANAWLLERRQFLKKGTKLYIP